MPTLQEEIDALEAAINTGAQSVSYGDRQVRYKSNAEMESRLAYLKGKQSQSTGGRSTFAGFKRG